MSTEAWIYLFFSRLIKEQIFLSYALHYIFVYDENFNCFFFLVIYYVFLLTIEIAMAGAGVI